MFYVMTIVEMFSVDNRCKLYMGIQCLIYCGRYTTLSPKIKSDKQTVVGRLQ